MKETFFTKHPILCALAFAVVALLPLFALKDYAPGTELRAVSIAQEALASGNIFTFTNHGAAAPDVMPLHMWLLMLLTSIFGGHVMLADAMLSLIPACVVVIVMDRWLVASLGNGISSSQRAATALMLATSAAFMLMAGNVGPAMLTTMWIVLAMWEFFRIYSDENCPGVHRWILPLWLFLGMLSGGIIGLVMPVAAMLIFAVLDGHPGAAWKALGLRAWVVIISLTAIWLAAVWMEGGPMPALLNMESDKPFWLPAATIWVALLPWCLLAVPAVFIALAVRKGEDAKAASTARLMSITVIAGIVLLAVFGARRAVDLLPVVPFAVALAALVLVKKGHGAWSRLALVLPAVLFVIGGVFIALVALAWRLVPALQDYLPFPFVASPLFIVAGAAIAVGGVAALARLRASWAGAASFLASGLLLACFAISPLTGRINDFVGYANALALVPEDAPVYTLYLDGAADMDALLGREVKDFGEDSRGFIAAAPSSCTLIVGRADAALDRTLTDVLAGQSLTNVGPCSVYDFKRNLPVKQAVAETTRKERREARREARRTRREKRQEAE